MGYSIPVFVALEVWKVYILVSAVKEQDSVRFAVPQKGLRMWMFRIWSRMIGLALTRNYNWGSTLFAVPEDAHSQSRKYRQAHEAYCTAYSVFAMMT
jgi:hypothetical protein